MKAAIRIEENQFQLVTENHNKFSGSLAILRHLVEGKATKLIAEVGNIPESVTLNLSGLGIEFNWFHPQEVEKQCKFLLRAHAKMRAEDDAVVCCKALLNLEAIESGRDAERDAALSAEG